MNFIQTSKILNTYLFVSHVTDNGEAMGVARATTQAISYIPYGEVFVEQQAGGWSSPYLFNAKELDSETGLYYYGARYLDPSDAMWLSVDPLWEKYVGMTPYNYCGGNPVVMVDPDGREKKISFHSTFPSRSELSGLTGHEQQKLINQTILNQKLERWGMQYTRNRGVIHTFQHGINGGRGVTYNTDSNTKDLIRTVKDFEEKILNDTYLYQKNKKEGNTSLLVMHSCQTGKEGGFAQKISKELDLVVVAPSEDINVNALKNGTFTDEVDNSGVYNVYYKGEKMDSFSGKTKPLFDIPEKTIEKYKSMYESQFANKNTDN